MGLSEIVTRGWEAVGAGDWDALVADYTEDMTFVMPGQSDVVEGRAAFRSALESLGSLLPPGFEITGLRQIEGDGEVVTVMDWRSEKVDRSQLTVLFRFRGDKVFEERWFIETQSSGAARSDRGSGATRRPSRTLRPRWHARYLARHA
jgi:ketosteroid isomerase-like protein